MLEVPPPPRPSAVAEPQDPPDSRIVPPRLMAARPVSPAEEQPEAPVPDIRAQLRAATAARLGPLLTRRETEAPASEPAGKEEIASLASPEALQAFDRKVEVGKHTLNALELDRQKLLEAGFKERELPLTYGTFGLALQGLNGHVEGLSPRMDIDVFMSTKGIDRVNALVSPDSADIDDYAAFVPSNKHYGADERLTLDGIHSSAHLQYRVGAAKFDSWRERAVTIDGKYDTLPPDVIADLKLRRGDFKDFTGVIQAQLIAAETGHPVAKEPLWRAQVDRAVKMAAKSKVDWLHPPDWYQRVRAADFAHPALR